MAQYRAVYCKFWSDSKVLDKFTVEDKYFWLYLLTNERTSQIGVYKFIKKIVAVELGYSLDVVETLLKRFETYHKLIKYSSETQEICILNWGVYNLNKGGAPVIACIKSELSKVEDVGLIKYMLDNPKNNINEKVLEEINDFISLHYIKNKDVYLNENENENENEARTTTPTTNRTTTRKEVYIQHFHLILYKTEYEELCNDFNKDKIDEMIMKIQAYAETYLKKYSNFNLIIRNWIKKDIYPLNNKKIDKSAKERMKDWINEEKQQEVKT